MIGRLTGAACRGLMVAILISTPALMLPGVLADSSQITLLVALLAGFLTFIEYSSSVPSIVEFRDAKPFNRLRFVCFFAIVVLSSAILNGQMQPKTLTSVITTIGTIIGNLLDFPFSPVRLIVLMLPGDAEPALIVAVRSIAGVAYAISLLMLAIFFVLVRFMGWPSRHGAFNVWVNLPLFDPTAGGDVLQRLQRDARVNLALGFLLPFVIPAVFTLMATLLDSVTLERPQTLIWTVSAWAFIPASLMMRGMAIGRIASMVLDKRRQAYAETHREGGFQAA